MNNKKYIVSPCGTSLLTNVADREKRKLVTKYANEKNKDKIPTDDRDKLKNLIKEVSQQIDKANYKQAAEMSAELNCIIQIYDGFIPTNNHDYHLLLSTDTWLGKETAKLVEKWLKIQNPIMTIEMYRQPDLQTGEIVTFQSSLSELVKKFYDELPDLSKTGYKIIFNLTGGFKSVQGFLQTIANLLADEVVYIFERSSELMRIPRLPIKIVVTEIIKENIAFFRNISIGVSYPVPKNIPETLLLTIDEETALSPWGDIIWEESKLQIYKEELLLSPMPEKIKYGEKFEKEVQKLPKDRKKIINCRIDQLNKYFFNTKDNPASLDFKQLKGTPKLPSTHEIDAWSDKDAQRIYGHFDKKCFVLDALARGLH